MGAEGARVGRCGRSVGACLQAINREARAGRLITCKQAPAFRTGSGLGDRGFLDHLGDEVVGGDFLGFRFVGESHAVAEDVGSDLLHE